MNSLTTCECLQTVLVQISNWPNLLRRYAGSELGGHHSGPDCGHGRRPVRQPADLELFLPDFCCQFNPADRHRRRIEALEAQHRSDPLFYTAVILFDSVIEIVHLGIIITEWNQQVGYKEVT